MTQYLLIKIDDDSGEAEVLPINEQPLFDGQSELWKLDVLKDIIGDLDRMYEEEHIEWCKNGLKIVN